MLCGISTLVNHFAFSDLYSAVFIFISENYASPGYVLHHACVWRILNERTDLHAFQTNNINFIGGSLLHNLLLANRTDVIIEGRYLLQKLIVFLFSY